MRTVIRNNVFETNSSGTHCFCYMNDYDLKAFFNGDFFISADEDWEQASKITPAEYEKRKEEYIQHMLQDQFPSYYPEYSRDDLDALFPLSNDIVDGRFMQACEPLYGANQSWRHIVALPDRNYTEGHISMNIDEAPNENDPLESRRVDFEIYWN